MSTTFTRLRLTRQSSCVQHKRLEGGHETTGPWLLNRTDRSSVPSFQRYVPEGKPERQDERKERNKERQPPIEIATNLGLFDLLNSHFEESKPYVSRRM